MRFIKQRDGYSCGPVAAINMAKWLGYKNTYADLAYFQKVMETECPRGTSTTDFRQVIEGWGAKRMRQPTTDKMKTELEAGNALVVHVMYNSQHGHFYFIDGFGPKGFSCINVYRGKTQQWLPPREFYHKQMRGPEFRIWIVCPEESVAS